MKSKTILTLIITSLFFLIHCTQNRKPESFQSPLNIGGEDTISVNSLNESGEAFKTRMQDDSAIIYINKALSLAEKLNYKKGVAKSYYILGDIYLDMDSNDKAIKSYNASLSLSQELGDRNLEAWNNGSIGLAYRNQGRDSAALNLAFQALQTGYQLDDTGIAVFNKINIGVIFREQSNYSKALEYDTEALTLAEATNNEKGIETVTGNIGLVYSDKKNFDTALTYELKALTMSEELGIKKERARNLGNIGIARYGLKDTTSAINYYSRALQLDSSINNTDGIQRDLGNFGVVYSDKRDYRKAMECYSKSLKISKKRGDGLNEAITLGNVGEVFMKQGSFKDANETFLKSLSLSEDLDDEEGVRLMFKDLRDLNDTMGNSKRALYYSRKYETLDSLINSSNSKKKESAEEMGSNFEKKLSIDRAEHEKQKEEAKRKQNYILYGSTGLFAIIMLSFLLYRNYKKKTEIELKHSVSNTEMKSLRLQMNPHFIFNSLNSIDDYIQDNDIENSSLYLNKFSRLTRMILECSRREEVPLNEDLEALELYIQLENLRMKIKVAYKIEVSPDINTEQALIPPMLLQPFIENAFKHAYTDVEHPKLEINITMKNGMIHCLVMDNGKGIDSKQKVMLEKRDSRESLGLKITQERLDIINKLKKSKAYISLENVKDFKIKDWGTKVEVAVPVSYAV